MTESAELLTGKAERALGYIYAFGPKTPAQVAAHIGTTYGYTCIILKDLAEQGYLEEVDDEQRFRTPTP